MKVGSRDWSLVIARLFNTDPSRVRVDGELLHVGNVTYQIDRGVILLDDLPVASKTEPGTSEDVRKSFSHEWQAYGAILPEHEQEFWKYFDIVDMRSLNGKVVADLGCGSGRWSAKLSPFVGVVVLVDFSEAIFAARENLDSSDNAIFFRGDVTKLPFVDGSFDFVFSLGVLHHLAHPCLLMVNNLMRLSDRGLFYLYYSLDNRPIHYRYLLALVSAARSLLVRVRSERIRLLLADVIARVVYRPCIIVGGLAARVGKSTAVPLFEAYQGMSVVRLRQDAYDRFFTSIEQRVSRQDITDSLGERFEIRFSDQHPFWHFLLNKKS